jgi:flagellar protein FlbD
MIELTRLDESKVWINDDHILTAEETPDTVITFITGQKLIVKEPCIEIQRLIKEQG